MKYTLRLCDNSQAELKVESDSVPRVGETIVIVGDPFSVTEVRHVVEPDDGFNRGIAITDIIVLCEEG